MPRARRPSRARLAAAVLAADGNLSEAARYLGRSRQAVSQALQRALAVARRPGRKPGQVLVELDAEQVADLRAAGLSDRAIARQLGVSRRTLARRCPRT